MGSTESDPDNGKISDESPIGKAALKHKVGDIFEAETPAGLLNSRSSTFQSNRPLTKHTERKI